MPPPRPSARFLDALAYAEMELLIAVGARGTPDLAISVRRLEDATTAAVAELGEMRRAALPLDLQVKLRVCELAPERLIPLATDRIQRLGSQGT